MTSLASFWAGPHLSPFEKACLGSFARRGYDVHLYSFDALENLPDGIVQRDASELAPKAFLDRFIHNGRPNVAHFADYFRYLVFAKTGMIWIDSDIILLQPFETMMDRNIFVMESKTIMSNAIMRIDEKHPLLNRLIERSEALMGQELTWGQTGPELMIKVFSATDNVFKLKHPSETFFPIYHEEIWKVFLPEYKQECDKIVKASYGVHLFNNIIDRMGIWKSIAPPKGSFLANRFEVDNSMKYFEHQYPENVMRQLIGNWISKRTGTDITLRTLLKRLYPSFRNSASKYWLRSSSLS